MQKLDGPTDRWWCPRCGTLKEVVGHLGREFTNTEAPKLVDRVRGFVRMIDGTAAGRFLRGQAEAAGILESALPPGDRP
jgi:hypothetical protein